MANLATSKAGSDRNRTFLMILIPVLVLFVAFNTIPLLTGFFYSFTNSKGYGPFEIVGLQNYIDLFQDARVGNSYLFTFKLAVVSTILVNVLSLILAIGLSSKIKFKSALRGLYFVPRILGALVVGYVFTYFFTYIVPAVTGTDSILASADWAWIGIVVVLVWQACAQTTIIYITGLSSVPEDRRRHGLEQVPLPHVPAHHALHHHEHGPRHEGHAHGLRPDRGNDGRRPRQLHRVHLVSHLRERSQQQSVWLPVRKRSDLLHPHRRGLHCADEVPEQ